MLLEIVNLQDTAQVKAFFGEISIGEVYTEIYEYPHTWFPSAFSQKFECV